jgi:hypothetical protein
VDEGVFSERVRKELSRDFYAWVERRGSHESYPHLVVELVQRELKSVSGEELREYTGRRWRAA